MIVAVVIDKRNRKDFENFLFEVAYNAINDTIHVFTTQTRVFGDTAITRNLKKRGGDIVRDTYFYDTVISPRLGSNPEAERQFVSMVVDMFSSAFFDVPRSSRSTLRTLFEWYSDVRLSSDRMVEDAIDEAVEELEYRDEKSW